MMLKILSIVGFCLLINSNAYTQQPTQTIRGLVVDAASKAPLPYVNVLILGTSTGTTTDEKGEFSIRSVSVGRYDLKISYIGYEPVILYEVQVTSGREVFLNVSMREITLSMGEVVVNPNISKQQPLNTMAMVSAKMLSVEEARRFAGGFDDPARLVSAFAGVTNSGVSSNAIVVRGNNPQSLQWRLEGIEIPNPNHFTDIASFGGGGLTALSAQLIANSDFMTGAMPAEYGNALSGVFDVYMRNGNNQKREHTFQAGLVGIDFASEGPFKQGYRPSYIFNYRYSTLGLIEPIMPENAGGTTYQDLSFKLNLPTAKTGTFSVWGIGLADKSGATAKLDVNEWVYKEDSESVESIQFMAAGGINHLIFINDRQYLTTGLASTINGIDVVTDRLNSLMVPEPEYEIKNDIHNIVLSSSLNTKFSSRHSNRTGFVATQMGYDLLLKNTLPLQGSPQIIVDESGSSQLLNLFTSSKFDISSDLSANIGLHAQYFDLSKTWSPEPRMGLQYRLPKNQTISMAYGLHSRLERLSYYFIKDAAGRPLNRDLGFTKAHHGVLGYSINPTDISHFRVEIYYQHLFDAPVVDGTSFSLINQWNDWFFDSQLVGKGLGQNYGIDLTFERYMSKGFYYLATVSIFDSKYKGGDGSWRNTRYNRGFSTNALIGKEWQAGPGKRNVFGLNVRLSLQGGDRFTPVDPISSDVLQEPVFFEDRAFSEQFSPMLTSHVTASYTMNKNRSAHEIALKLLNATMYEEFQGFRYNYKTREVDIMRELIFIPNLSYKIEF